MKVTFLGTNGWYDTKTGNTTCTLIETEDYFIILDAGNGIHKLNNFIPESSKKPIFLFLSHFHIDHIEGLHILSKFNFNQEINIYGQPGSKKILNTFVNEPYTVPFDKLPFKVEVYEIDEGIHHVPFIVESKYLIHSSRCMGYRFEIDDKIIAYCTDTGTSENVYKLAENADLLITECSLKMGQSNPDWPHLNPEDAIKIAEKSGAKRLALTHFDANIYSSIDERKYIAIQTKDSFKNIIVSFDGLDINL
ncbi:MAG: MBL fold metallo-hydrolase [Methanobacterium sp.]|uniref:MBL fold metallo-hydrolase n=1 Tax=Methanobacterium sp. TaxID=2164 RepID=UPI003D657798|nr:MBL fold metallo-hydrolase [Methanobacterium sp.]